MAVTLGTRTFGAAPHRPLRRLVPARTAIVTFRSGAGSAHALGGEVSAMRWPIPARRTEDSRPDCVCGHHWDAHQHYRRGLDCSLCASGDCRRYRAQR